VALRGMNLACNHHTPSSAVLRVAADAAVA
jgi:hypothetical protein